MHQEFLNVSLLLQALVFQRLFTRVMQFPQVNLIGTAFYEKAAVERMNLKPSVRIEAFWMEPRISKCELFPQRSHFSFNLTQTNMINKE